MAWARAHVGIIGVDKLGARIGDIGLYSSFGLGWVVVWVVILRTVGFWDVGVYCGGFVGKRLLGVGCAVVGSIGLEEVVVGVLDFSLDGLGKWVIGLPLMFVGLSWCGSVLVGWITGLQFEEKLRVMGRVMGCVTCSISFGVDMSGCWSRF
ncbi:hypothetical protein Salat_0070200 [Sesamum alatum]|uniref:Transmembrane protein n=1 Tax=Sesamum alatum TaxID=300844 RepID=A0AAE1YWL9_9LAMI|nr:hypothetical protein Salat_0070200 [Sesamum alatum]